MPLYEYLCHSCGKTLEVLQKFSDEPLAVHEGCGGELEKLISRSAIQFKGSGWYVTDYAKSGSPANGAENGKPKEGGDSKSSDAKSSEGKSSDGKSSEGKSSDSSTTGSPGSGSSGSGSSGAGAKNSDVSRTSESASKPAPAAASKDSK